LEKILDTRKYNVVMVMWPQISLCTWRGIHLHVLLSRKSELTPHHEVVRYPVLRGKNCQVWAAVAKFLRHTHQIGGWVSSWKVYKKIHFHGRQEG